MSQLEQIQKNIEILEKMKPSLAEARYLAGTLSVGNTAIYSACYSAYAVILLKINEYEKMKEDL